VSIFSERIRAQIKIHSDAMAELEREWDKLDSMGTMVEVQVAIARRMVELSEVIAGYTNLLKVLEKK
jgi:hypothetical protein